jgi:hypothetical protein
MPATPGTIPPNAGMGRPAGSQNKVTKALKEMILTALDEVGGVEYLKRQATDNPALFLALLVRILPYTMEKPVHVIEHSRDLPTSVQFTDR